MLENIVTDYASINNGYLFDQLEKILLSAQEGNEHRTGLLEKAAIICRNEALNEYEQQNYKKCLHIIKYAMNKVFDIQNWDIINKLSENADLDDISFLDELVNTTNSFKGVFDCSRVVDILFDRFCTKAEESYTSMNYGSSIVILSNAMHYKTDSKLFELLGRIIDEHDSTETDTLFSLIKDRILVLRISDSEKTFLTNKMTKRFLSGANESFENKDYSEALKLIRNAAESSKTMECYQLYASIVGECASKENDYLNSDVNKILEYADASAFPTDTENMLKKLNDQYQSTVFKNVCKKLKHGTDIDDIDGLDCLNKTDEYGMTIAMYAALYQNTEAIMHIAKKYGNPAEYEQKNILGLDFGTIICYSYSNVPDSILELFSWYVDAKKEMDDTNEWIHKREKELGTQLNRLNLELSKARWQKNYQLLEECQDAASKIHDAKDELMNIWENSDVKLNQENDRWYKTGYQKSWNAILAYLVMDFKEVIDSNNKCIEDLALNKFTDEYLQQNLTEKGEFETTKAYQQRTEEMKNAAKMKFESNKSSLIESFITKTNAESKEYNLPIELARLFISSKLDKPVKLEKYDADKQEFAIVWDGFTIKNCNQLRMPINVAPDFKQSLPNGEFVIIPQSYKTEASKYGGINLFIKCSVEFQGVEYSYDLCQLI